MRTVLHIGAHRTATTTFQAYIRGHAEQLHHRGIGFWGPRRTRNGMFAGIQPTPGLGLNAARRARGRILLQMDRVARKGAHTLLISEENMMGSVRLNMRTGMLYPDVGQRLSRYVCAFDGCVDKVVLNVRCLDHYWASAIAFGVARGHSLPDAAWCDTIAYGRRTWRDVVTDVACAAPRARIEVVPFEAAASRPHVTFAACTGVAVRDDTTSEWLNRSADCGTLRHLLAERGEDVNAIPDQDGRWTPFDAAARAALREAYAEDMHWLVAGADGLATLTEELDHTCAGKTPPMDPRPRGQKHDIEQRRMAQPG